MPGGLRSKRINKENNNTVVNIGIIDPTHIQPNRDVRYIFVDSHGHDGGFVSMYPIEYATFIRFALVDASTAIDILIKYSNSSIALSPFLMKHLSDAATKHLTTILNCNGFYFQRFGSLDKDNFYKICEIDNEALKIFDKFYLLKEQKNHSLRSAPRYD